MGYDILANQTVRTLWVAHSDRETRDHQYAATVAALIGIEPKDEIDGMDRSSAPICTQCCAR
jgi:hypothetical protein